MIEREKRERERERKEKKPFYGDFRSKLGRTRVKATLRDKSYAWVPESQDFAKVQGSSFYKKQEKGSVPGNHAN